MFALRGRYWRCPSRSKDRGRDIDPAACARCGAMLRGEAQTFATGGRGPEAARVELARPASRQRWILFGGFGVAGGVLLLCVVLERLPWRLSIVLWLALSAAVFGAMTVLARRSWR